MLKAGIVFLLPLGLGVWLQGAEGDRSPQDVALSADGRFAISVNRSYGSISLVDLSRGNVVLEVPGGKDPFAIAVQGETAVVTEFLGESVRVLKIRPPVLDIAGKIHVGYQPRGIALAGTQAYVALSGEDAVVRVDLVENKVTGRLAVGTEPWHVALTPDKKKLAVGCARSGELAVIDTEAWKVSWKTPIPDARNLRHLAISPDGEWAYVPHIVDRGATTTLPNLERGLVINNRLSRISLREERAAESLALDQYSFGAADLDGIAISPDGGTLVLGAAGTHELFLLGSPLPFSKDVGVFVDQDLARDRKRFRRIRLESRPLGLAWLPGSKEVVVADALSNALHVVSPDKPDVRSISLGGPKEPSLARRGEALFTDGARSWSSWYSCNTCHVEGHTNGGLYDTLADGKAGNPKKTLSLRGVTQTGPWTWHGWQGDLGAALQDSFKKTMAHHTLEAQDLEALKAYLATLDFVSPPEERDLEGEKRGRAVFESKGCDACHRSPTYTSGEIYVVGLESPEDVYKGFNPPSLRGIVGRSPYLHDGRGKTLEEVLEKHHRPSKLSGKPDLSSQEMKDLLEFLRGL